MKSDQNLSVLMVSVSFNRIKRLTELFIMVLHFAYQARHVLGRGHLPRCAIDHGWLFAIIEPAVSEVWVIFTQSFHRT